MTKMLRYELRKLLYRRSFLLALVIMLIVPGIVVSMEGGLAAGGHEVFVIRGRNDTVTRAMQEITTTTGIFAQFVVGEDAYVFDEAAEPLLTEGGELAKKYGFSIDPDTVERASYAGGTLYPAGTEHVLEVWFLPRVWSDFAATAFITGLTFAGVLIGGDFRRGTFCLPIAAGVSRNTAAAAKLIVYVLVCAIVTAAQTALVLCRYIPHVLELTDMARLAEGYIFCMMLTLVPAALMFAIRNTLVSTLTCILLFFAWGRLFGLPREPGAAAVVAAAAALMLTAASALWTYRRDAPR